MVLFSEHHWLIATAFIFGALFVGFAAGYVIGNSNGLDGRK